MHKFLEILKFIAPIALAANPATREAAPFIAMAIQKAEETFGPGNGAQKLEAARDLTFATISAQNALVKPEQQIDITATMTAFDGAVATTIDAVKVIQGVKQALPKKQHTDPPPTNPAPTPAPVN